jgi:hypothetical protein
MNSTIACRVSARSFTASMVANDWSIVSPRNWPFSRVGVSRKTFCAEYSAECRMRSKTASSVGLSLVNVAASAGATSVACVTAAMSRTDRCSPGSLISR